MSYDYYDLSVDSSQPDELFKFVYSGDGSVYAITSSAYPVDFQGETYSPVPCSRTPIKRTPEPGKNGMTVKMDRNNEYFARYVVGSLTYATTMTIYTVQPDGSYIDAWAGVVKSVAKTDSAMEVTANPISTSASRPILHRKYQIQCPHALYSYYCGVNKATYTRTGTVSTISGTTITSTVFSAEADGWFAGGTVTISNEKKTIVSHTGNTIEVLESFYEASAGDSLSASAGCAHDIATCDSKFSNELNFGGCPWIPSGNDITRGKAFTY